MSVRIMGDRKGHVKLLLALRSPGQSIKEECAFIQLHHFAFIYVEMISKEAFITICK